MTILAYIDPGSGAILLQAIVAGVIAFLAVFRNSLGGFFRRVAGRGRSEDQGGE